MAHKLDMLKTLRRIVLEVSAAPDLTQTLNVAVERVKEALHADACSIFLVDEESGEYVLMATIGLNEDMVGKARIQFGQGLVGLVGERAEPIHLENAPEHPNFLIYPEIEEDEYKAFIGMPLINQGELLGVLVVQQKKSRLFAEEEEALLMTLAVQLAGEIAFAKVKGALQDFGKKRGKKIETILEGISGAPGIALGETVVVYPAVNLDAVPDQPAKNIEDEIKSFRSALKAARKEIVALKKRAQASFTEGEIALFEAYTHLLDSRTLLREIEHEIRQGLWAQAALKRVIKKYILNLESQDDLYLQERAMDFKDLGRRILFYLQEKKRKVLKYPKRTILVSEEVTATNLMEVPTEQLAGIVSGAGSGNSHVAILARALGIPAVMGITGLPVSQMPGADLIVDGHNGFVYISPSSVLKREFKQLAEKEQQLSQELESLRDLPAITPDGQEVSLLINSGLEIDSDLSSSVGAEGIGLYRTELPFMLRDRFPSVEEQRNMYRELLQGFAPRPVVMRTLDIGGDKALPYFPVNEENPFLGWRGIRISLDHPEIFLQQIRAMLQASQGLNNLMLLLPMISSIREIEQSIQLIQQAYEELLEEHIEIQMPPIGVMIEVPAAVYQAYEIAQRVDFISVGSNDLIQYILAVDRNNPRVADLYNGLHPAVLRALVEIVKSGHRAGKTVSICGELAGDPLAALLLLAMGFDAFSMNAKSLPKVKWVIRNFSKESAKIILKEVLEMDDPLDIRNHLELALEEAGLGKLVRI